jgi:RNA polymerase sigma-70 factor (ECF subfamily)
VREEAEALVRRLRAGLEREESARRLDQLLRPRLARYFAAHGFVAAELDDLVQQTLVRVFQGVGELRTEAAFLGWLFVITRNVGSSARRRSARDGAVMVAGAASDVEPPARAAGDGRTPETRLELARVQRELAGLPRQQRRCLILAARDGLAYAEIGELLGLSVLTVRNHLAAARRRLRRALGETEEERR